MWKPRKKKARFGPVFLTNFCIIWECVCLIMQGISISTNTWYVSEHVSIAYSHGGLWNECFGDIDRTFCSPRKNVPVWLQVCQALALITLSITFVDIVYIMVAMARKRTRLSVMTALSNISGLLFFIALVTYSAKGFDDSHSPGTSYIIAWVTFIVQLIESSFCIYTFIQVTKMSKVDAYEAGIIIEYVNR